MFMASGRSKPTTEVDMHMQGLLLTTHWQTLY